MSKANQIRKKALDHVRKQKWGDAVKEFRRLAEIDQSNPNVFNELGDVYLKMGNKADAFDAFQTAIESYARVSLHNNAVAVCKKVLRLIPGRYDVLVSLGTIRMKQGLSREGESYYSTYLEKIAVEPSVEGESFVKNARRIVEHAGDSVPVLQTLSECLFQHGQDEVGGEVVVALFKAFMARGEEEAADKLRGRIETLGLSEQIAGNVGPAADGSTGPVITEDNIWTESHSAGERIEVDGGSRESTGVAVGAGENDDAISALGTAENPAVSAAAEGAAGTSTGTGTIAPPPPPSGDSASSSSVVKPNRTSESEDASASPGAAAGSPGAEPSPPAGEEPSVDTGGGTAADSFSAPWEDDSSRVSSSAESLQVSAIIDDDGTGAEKSDSDYRSHYDLGMAYLEMELYTEAVKEFQEAALSPQLGIKSLEMVGHCFIQQGQAGLAIKQLTRGLEIAGADNREAIGIRYNLGLAYEMMGDAAQAKTQFEEVYVCDVTFREVAGKIKKYSAG